METNLFACSLQQLFRLTTSKLLLFCQAVLFWRIACLSWIFDPWLITREQILKVEQTDSASFVGWKPILHLPIFDVSATTRSFLDLLHCFHSWPSFCVSVSHHRGVIVCGFLEMILDSVASDLAARRFKDLWLSKTVQEGYARHQGGFRSCTLSCFSL